MNGRILELVKPFTGKEDVEAWLSKLEIVVASQRLKNEETIIPLLLEGDALAVYMEMKEETKKSPEEIKRKLRKAFGEDPFEAFRKLCDLRWTGEPIEVYASRVRRLLRLAQVDNDLLMKRAVVSGLPTQVRKELRTMRGVEEADLEEILERARVELSDKVVKREIFSKSSPENFINEETEILKCFSCGGNHLKRECAKRYWSCFKCGRIGHIGKMCQQGNEERGAIVQEMAP